jgi:hypothetical protein
MARRRAETGDERQAELFSASDPEPGPTAVKRAPRERSLERARLDGSEPPYPAKVTVEELVARLSQRELEGLAAGLDDEQLASLVLGSVRALKRRLARSVRGPRGARSRGAGALERAARRLVEELREETEADHDAWG